MRKMVESNMLEEFEGGNLFDQIDDLLDFPTDALDSAFFDSDPLDSSTFPPVWHHDSPGFSGCATHAASDLSAELSVPYEDIVQLEWLSTFVENSFSDRGLTVEKPQATLSDSKDQFQTSSPISVLDSNTFPVCHEKRARSKRPRPPTFTRRAPIHVIHPMSSSSLSKSNRKMKIKILPPTSPPESQSQNENPNVGSVRKCKHCEITKTPQWRSGPMGPKTLCNACGVRYKKGCLYPEYRPAASPTFVESLHSNSHKKVLEMRGC